MSLSRPNHPNGDQLETLLLEYLHDLANKSPLNSIRFDHDESSLSLSTTLCLQLERCPTCLVFGDFSQRLPWQDGNCLFEFCLIVLVLGETSRNKCSGKARDKYNQTKF